MSTILNALNKTREEREKAKQLEAAMREGAQADAAQRLRREAEHAARTQQLAQAQQARSRTILFVVAGIVVIALAAGGGALLALHMAKPDSTTPPAKHNSAAASTGLPPAGDSGPALAPAGPTPPTASASPAAPAAAQATATTAAAAPTVSPDATQPLTASAAIATPAAEPPTPTRRPPKLAVPELADLPAGSVVDPAKLGWKLEGILADPTSPGAIINGRVIAQGDYVGAVKILSIKNNELEIEANSQRYRVRQ